MTLSETDKERIHAAVTAAEARTPVHIAVNIVPASDRYLLFPIVWGAILALAAGGVLALAWPHMGVRQVFSIEAVTFVLLSLLLDWRPVRLMLVPRHIRTRYARALAHREFATRILASRERKGGVLLFVSLAERYAEILADRDTHARVGGAVWDKILSDYMIAAKSGRIADGIVEAVTACAAKV
jgi:putative membrane protein